MMGAQVTVTIKGLDQTLSDLSADGEKIAKNIERNTTQLGKDSLNFFKEVTPVRSGTLRSGDVMSSQPMGFRLSNEVRYAIWVNDGHMTPAGWHTRRGFRPAKRRSRVAGRHFLEKTVDFIEGEIPERFSHLLGD